MRKRGGKEGQPDPRDLLLLRLEENRADQAVPHSSRVDQHRVHNTVNRRLRTDPDRQRRNRPECKARRLRCLPPRKLQIDENVSELGSKIR